MKTARNGRYGGFLAWAAVCVLALWPGGVCFGASAAQADLLDLSVEELRTIKVANVTGASKFEQKVTEAPSSISIVTAEDIRAFGYRTLADILRGVSSFYMTNDRNYSYAGTRGFNRPGDYNTRVLLMVDGHRLNDAVYEQAQLGTEFPLDVDLIDRIEIVRGPGSSLYGSNAFFGVINVITRSGTQVAGTEASVSAGTYDTYSGRLTYGAARPGGAGLLLSGSMYDSGGARHLYYPEYSSINGGVADHKDGDSSHQMFARATVGDFTLAGLYSSREKVVPTGSFGAVFNDPNNRTIDERAYADLSYRRSMTGGTAVMARLYYDYFHFTEDYLLDYPPPTRNRDIAIGTWMGGELQATGLVTERNKATAGAEYRGNTGQDQRNFDLEPAATYLDDKRRSRQWALYVQDEYRMMDSFRVNAGVRYDHYDSFGGTTNPRLALIYAPLEQSTIKLIAGTAFRAPNVFETYYDDGVSQLASPDLQPEKIRTAEVIYEQYLGSHVRTSLSAFTYRIDNLITAVTDTVSGLSQFRNVEETEANGAEIEVEGAWSNGYRGRASYTYQKARDSATGAVLTNSPLHLAKLRIVAPLARDRVFLDPEILFTSRRTTVGGGSVHAFTVVNLTLLGRRIAPGLDASLSVYNLFDREYGDPSAGPPQHQQDVILQDGRTVRLKVTYKF